MTTDVQATVKQLLADADRARLEAIALEMFLAALPMSESEAAAVKWLKMQVGNGR